MPMPKGHKHTAEARAKMSAARRKWSSSGMAGKHHSPESRAKISKKMLGHRYWGSRELSPETRAKISESLRGNLRSLGRTLSPETRAKLSAAKRGRPKSLAWRAKIKKGLAGDNPRHHVRMTAKYGPNWRKSYPKKRGRLTSAGKKGRPLSQAQRAQLATARTMLKPSHRSKEWMQLIARATELKTRRPTDLLFLKDQAVAADAKAFIQSVIDGHHHRGPHVTYDLADVRRYLRDDLNPKQIASRLNVTTRHAQRLVRQVRDADGAKTTN